MMSKADGIKVLKAIREIELQNNVSKEECVKIMITTAIGETDLKLS